MSAGEEVAAVRPAPRLETLRGVRLAVLDSGMRGTERLMRALATALRKESGARVDVRRKPTPYRGASQKLVDEVAKEFGAVVLGVTDCAISNARSLRDALELEHDWALRALLAPAPNHALLERMGIHRALRLAGCKNGARVTIGGREVRWRYPGEKPEDRLLPGGMGSWNSHADGIRLYPVVRTPSPVKRLTGKQAADRARDLTPAVLRAILR